MMTEKILAAKLMDRNWRLENLYWIVDKDGNKIKFKPNKAQKRLLMNMHWRNVILKARQLGFTTFICIFALDLVLFNANINAGIIAHTKDDAEFIFQNKIKFAYMNLPEAIKNLRKPDKDDAGTLRIKHGENDFSTIRVATSLRSGTYQLIHISEHGKICAWFPKKAMEIKTGTLPSAHGNAFVFIESTAEGRHGDFYDYCNRAQEITATGKKLGNYDYKFHFFAWYEDPANTASIDTYIPDDVAKYLYEKEIQLNIKFTQEQKAWYAVNKRVLGDEMTQEHPTTPEEAFDKKIKGAYYSNAIAKARAEGRIGVCGYDKQLPVHTFWDLGVGDSNAIWFGQFNFNEIRLIDYYEDSDIGLTEYIKVLKDKDYVYGEHFAPHDLRQREYISGLSRLESADKLGIKFKVLPALAIEEGIEAVRAILNKCIFDYNKCQRGILCLENYTKRWNENLEQYGNEPLHNWASNGADAFRYLAVAYKYERIEGKFLNKKYEILNEDNYQSDDWDPLMMTRG